MLVIHILTEAEASSSKSIALSGNLRSGIYLIDKSTQATTATSEIFTP
jgi:hypothetical protein